MPSVGGIHRGKQGMSLPAQSVPALTLRWLQALLARVFEIRVGYANEFNMSPASADCARFCLCILLGARSGIISERDRRAVKNVAAYRRHNALSEVFSHLLVAAFRYFERN